MAKSKSAKKTPVIKTQNKNAASKKASGQIDLAPIRLADPMRIAIVTSRFNEEITSKLEAGAMQLLEGLNCEIYSVSVPGAIEIPITIQSLFESQKVDGAIALGAVIRGDTTHYEEVCRSVERALTTLMLEHKKPIGFGVLTTENEEQAEARAGGVHGNKGADAAQVVIEMIGLLKEIRTK